jgi:hypothetical protein
MSIEAIFNAERPVGDQRHIWVHLCRAAGKIDLSYRIVDHDGMEFSNSEAHEFVHQAAHDLLISACEIYNGMGVEVPDLFEAELNGMNDVDGKRYDLILRYEVVTPETVSRGRLN